MFFTAFSTYQTILFLFSVICFLIAVRYRLQEKEIHSLIFLFLGAAVLFAYAAMLDPFLNLWDERFHALVAKNMRNHSWMPTLYDDDFMPMAYNDWDRHHIWLHKQPLFLWQMMLSFKMFGVSEFSLRLPSIILGLATAGAIYRSSRLLIDSKTAFYTTFLFITGYYVLNLIAGRECTDHSDFVLMAYVSLSIWSFIEYTFKRKKYWALLAGLFAGLAFLTKWMPGFLVFALWGLYFFQRKWNKHALLDFAMALGIAIIIALPWQIYTFVVYPVDAIREWNYNSAHLTHALEGHDGPWWFHFKNFPLIFGWASAILFIPGCYLFIKKVKKEYIAAYFLVLIVCTLLFYSFAATKMSSYPIILCLPIALIAGTTLAQLIEWTETYKNYVAHSLVLIMLVVVFMLNFRPSKMVETHSTKGSNNEYAKMLIHNKKVFRSLHFHDPTILFNVKGRHYVEAMFYSPYFAYGFIPDSAQYATCKIRGFKMALFPGKEKLPAHLLNDPDVRILKDTLKGYD
jgi:4-amino-4-deoxy-L-arabinose transferase